MSARLPAPPPWQPADYELEQNALGVALFGYPLPPHLERADFFGGPHRLVFDAVQALGAGANLATVYAYLRDVLAAPVQQPRYGLDVTGLRKTTGPVVTSVELVRWMDAADHAMRSGWAVDFDRLRELRRQRKLLEVIAKIQIGFRLGGLDWSEAKGMLEVVLT